MLRIPLLVLCCGYFAVSAQDKPTLSKKAAKAVLIKAEQLAAAGDMEPATQLMLTYGGQLAPVLPKKYFAR